MRANANALMIAAVCTFTLASFGMSHAIEPFATWYYSFAWWSYIAFVSGWLARRRCDSAWPKSVRATLQLLGLSVVIWVAFEYFNFRLSNWSYLDLPSRLPVRWAGYTVAYATVLPGLFLTERLLASWRVGRGSPGVNLGRWPMRLGWLGLPASAAPLVWPRYCFPLVWVGPTLVFAALNYAGGQGVLKELEERGPAKIYRLLGAGAICGLLWELWNFWARSKWVYHIPFLDVLRVFEMPLAGFLGFAPFAIECHEMYLAARRWLSYGEHRPYEAWRGVAVWLLLTVFILVGYAGIDRFTVERFQ